MALNFESVMSDSVFLVFLVADKKKLEPSTIVWHQFDIQVVSGSTYISMAHIYSRVYSILSDMEC